jgi:transcriptional regulator with GAF, ATPase, and Fis domain
MIPVVYSVWALGVVARDGDIGLNCVLGIEIKEAVPDEYDWTPTRPEAGDRLVRIDGQGIDHYPAFVEAKRRIGPRIGERVEVEWRVGKEGPVRSAWATVRRRPFATYGWSILWLAPELAILAVAARVLASRPADESAQVFFTLCIVTVGAYMGGYHWTEIVVEPPLIYPFVAFALFVPVVSLHFYLVFPRRNPTFGRHRRSILWALYGVPTVFALAIWGCMAAGARFRGAPSLEAAAGLGPLIGWIKGLALAYIATSVLVFTLCYACLNASYRSASTRAERSQTYWILLATRLAVLLIGYVLYTAWWEPARLGLNSAAWPMYLVSLLYTTAYALSITRYNLLRVEEIYNRSKLYVLFSLLASLLYTLVLVGTSLLIGERLQANQSSRGALVAGGLAITILVLFGATRERFQRAIDRRFHREKYQFDQAMQKMNLAVGSLVDRGALGRRLLGAAAEVLRLEWGAIYLTESPGGPFTLAAWHGPEPDERSLPANDPLAERLRVESTVRGPHAKALSSTRDPAADTMIALGGEIARSLEADGEQVGLMVLGPKRSGLPYEDEEVAFLGALGSVAMLALHSAGIQQTLERLNLELRDKVDKIAEQQRRILLLQDQLTGRGKPEAGRIELAEAADPEVFAQIRGSGPAVARMLEVARKVAGSGSAVLIRGESGTGKELLAQAIHAAGPRATRPFVQVHCAALSQGLLESELFGHVKGAFTDASRDRVGRFEQADGGTLFLDEIGDINPEVQTKLLRVLQEMAFERVGSSQTIAVDVRIIAATHQDLEGLIRLGKFREDLFYRLNVIPIRTPSLRERKEDIFELAVHFLGRHAARVGRDVGHIDDDAVEALMGYDWPGNIRELENVIERAVVLCEGPALTLADLPPEVGQPSKRRPRQAPAMAQPGRLRPAARSFSRSPGTENPGAATLDLEPEAAAFERHRLVDALEQARGNKSVAARLLGMPRSTFFSKLKKHGLASGE